MAISCTGGAEFVQTLCKYPREPSMTETDPPEQVSDAVTSTASEGISRLRWFGYWRKLALWTVIVSTVSGAAVTMVAAHGLSPFGGLEFVPRVVGLSITRELCARMAPSASALALVHWAHSVGIEQLQPELRRATGREVSGALFALPGVVVGAFISSLVVARFAYAIRCKTFVFGVLGTLAPLDPLVGVASTLVSACLLGLLLLPVLPILTRSRWPLFIKLALGWLCLCLFNGILSTVTSWALAATHAIQ